MSIITYSSIQRGFTVRTSAVIDQRSSPFPSTFPYTACRPAPSTSLANVLLDHIAHHILTLYALGASPEEIQQHYDRNKSYQRPLQPVDDKVLENLHDYQKFHEYSGDERHYHDYLVFFQGEIDKKGYEEVINEYALKDDERANHMLVRLHAGKLYLHYSYKGIADDHKGFLHPIIHLGFGVEFKQPAIIAEALAQAAVHDTWIGPPLFAAEKSATPEKSKSMVEILDNIRADTKLSTAAHWDDPNKIRDGLLVRAHDEMIKYASQWIVKVDELEAKTAEMIDAAGISLFLTIIYLPSYELLDHQDSKKV